MSTPTTSPSGLRLGAAGAPVSLDQRRSASSCCASTGFLIGQPSCAVAVGEASFSYWFGRVRFIHFVAAFVFFFNFLFRIYWGFVGNQFARWDNFLPLGRNRCSASGGRRSRC